MADCCIPYRETGYFSSLICDYLDENEQVKPLYHLFPTLKNFRKQSEAKAAVFPESTRDILVSVLEKQYADIPVSEAVQKNISLLKSGNTFTVTTGHQLNLFTGPLYFLYKIISTVNLCRQLKKEYPGSNFVPVYWMATEDHDFEEINHFNFKGRKVVWERESGGAVGKFSTDGLDKVLASFSKELDVSQNAKHLEALFREAYLNHKTLNSATRFLANALFAEYGLVIIDADQPQLKQLFTPFMKDEIIHKTAFKTISETNKKLGGKYTVQVNPREINLFYLSENSRERIIEKDGKYVVNNTDISFSQEEILRHIDEHPERFSPNVLLRPLYQEVILPNLCYIGGGGEIAYWLQLKDYFEAENVAFPILLLRNSALLVSEKTRQKLEKLEVSIKDIFLPKSELQTKYTRQISEINIDFSEQKAHLQRQFAALYTLAEKTDKSFIGAVAAQEKKQMKGLDNLEKRLLKAQKRKFAERLSRLDEIQCALFPSESLQERNHNFSEWYLAYGENLIPKLFEELEPLDLRFSVVSL